MSTEVKNNGSQHDASTEAAIDGNTVLPAAVNDAIEFIADALGEEVRLRQMIDLWCIAQLGNTDEALEKADAMFTAARGIFYRSDNGR